MNRRFRLPIFTCLLISGALAPLTIVADSALADCVVEESTEESAQPGNNPTSGQTIVCANNLDSEGVNGPDANEVTVEIEAPSGGISVTGQPGVLLGDEATVDVAGPGRPVSTSGDRAVAIEVLNGATITIEGVVSTSGGTSPGISTGDNAVITISGGTVRTGGSESPAITVGANATVEVTGNARIATGNSNSDGIVLSGENGTLTVAEEAIVTTSSGLSNPIQIDGANSTVNVLGNVRSSSGDATAILGTAQDLTISVKDGAVVTAQSSNSNAIEMTSTGAVITVENGGEVKISSGNSAAIISGSEATVEVDGTVSASSSASQGIVLGDRSSLTVQSRGVIETSSSESQAVLVGEMAESATITVERGGNIDAVGAQAIVDKGMTNTTVVVDGTVFGGSSEPVLDMGAGSDTVTVNGTVRATSASTVIDLGAGDDTLNDNSSQTIAGPGTLVSAGDGMDTLNINNGKPNNSSSYAGFETTNVGANNNPDDPANGRDSTLNVDDDQSGNQINAQSGGRVNVRNGGTANVTADNEGQTGSGQQGGETTFEEGSTANVRSENRTGPQATQEFTNTTFAEGTQVRSSSGFVRGRASNNAETQRGEIALESDFANSAKTENASGFGDALNALAEAEDLTVEQQAALDDLIGQAPTADAANALLSQLSGEIGAQTAASGMQAATLFNDVLLFSDGFEIGDNGAWVSGFGELVDVDENSASADFDANTYGLAVGYERAITPISQSPITVGVGFGYSNTNVNGMADSADIDAYSVGTYVEGTRGAMTGSVAASYSYQNIGGSESGTDGSGNVFVASSEGFYDLSSSPNFAVGPLGRIGAAFGNYSGFSSGNDVLQATYDNANVSQLSAGLGVRVGGNTQTGAGLVSYNLDLLYEGLLGSNEAEFDGQLADSSVSVAAPFANDDSFLVGAEAGIAFSNNTSLRLRYEGALGSDIRSHTGEIKFAVDF